MKSFKTRLLSLFVCLTMFAGTFAGIPVTASATERSESTVSENEIEITTGDISSETSTSEGAPADTQTAAQEGTQETTPSDAIMLSFYDSDGTTLLYSFAATGKSTTLEAQGANYYPIDPVYKGYEIDKWHCVTNETNYSPMNLYYNKKVKTFTGDGNSAVFHAKWNSYPYNFDISYNLNGGTFDSETSDDVPYNFTVESETITLPTPVRVGYLFNGWFSDAALTTPITAIPAGTYINSDANGDVAPFAVYAGWTECLPGKISSVTATHPSTGTIKVSFTGVENAAGYEVTYSSNKNFKKKKTLTKNLEQKTSFTLTNLPKGKTYYFKVRAYNTDSTGEKCYGEYSSVASCKVKKGVKEVAAKSNSGKIKKVSVKNGNDLYVTATIKNRLKSADEFYYLVKVDPNTGKVLKQIAVTDKSKKVEFLIPLRDEDGTNHIHGKYGVAIKKGKKYMLVTSTSFINNPEDAAAYTAPFPTPTSKKGRQGLYNTDMGDKNYFVNFNLNTIIGTQSSHAVAYKYNGKTYYFNNPSFGDLKTVNEDGGTVTVQVMMQWNTNSKDLILKSGRKQPVPGRESITYYAFNTDNKAAREKLEAAFCFLAEYASKEDYHVDNWILGNEVNTYLNPNAKWYYAGNISHDKFMKNYASTYRMLYYAVKSSNKNGRVYICCDHTWINREQDWGTKYFTSAFDKEIKNQNKNIKWNLAYHAYSAVLTNADFWNDGSLAPNKADADFVSPNNLNILTNYVKKNFGKDVRIILSEQGFSCSGGVGSPYNNGRQTGEGVQAAAVAYLYYKAQFNDMIDAVIFSSGDHGGAGYQFDFHGRQAEATYKYMDTPQYEAYTSMHLSTIKQPSWSKAVKGFSDSKLKSMPNR